MPEKDVRFRDPFPMWHVSLNGKLQEAAEEEVFATYTALVKAVRRRDMGAFLEVA